MCVNKGAETDFSPTPSEDEICEVPKYISGLQFFLMPQSYPQTLYPTLETRAEQAPNPDNSTTLDMDRDQSELRRVVTDWRPSELVRTSMQAGMGLSGGSMARNGIGREQSRVGSAVSAPTGYAIATLTIVAISARLAADPERSTPSI